MTTDIEMILYEGKYRADAIDRLTVLKHHCKPTYNFYNCMRDPRLEDEPGNWRVVAICKAN